MTSFIQAIALGVLIGGIYALMASGLEGQRFGIRSS